MTDDDLVAKYAAEAKQSLDQEAQKRIEESVDPIYEAKLRARSIFDMIESDDLVPALLARLGSVRAALDGHGGGIAVSMWNQEELGYEFVLDLTGACLSCGAAPGTLEGVRDDLENDSEISTIRFSSSLLDTFDELGREFILAHGNVEFVDVPSGI